MCIVHVHVPGNLCESVLADKNQSAYVQAVTENPRGVRHSHLCTHSRRLTSHYKTEEYKHVLQLNIHSYNQPNLPPVI